jgi:hypothetical protein
MRAFIKSAASWVLVIDRSPFVAVNLDSCRRRVSFLSFACLLHARLNPFRQHPWSIVPRHGPLVYVRRCL